MIGTYIKYPNPLRPHAAGQLPWDGPQYASHCNLPTVLVGEPASIAILELGGGYVDSDIQAAFAKWKLPAPKIVNVSVQGARNSPGQDADGEVALDIEWAAVPGAYSYGKPVTIYVIWTPNTNSGFAAGIDAMVATGAKIGSISWGGPENSWGNGYQATSAALARAAAAGMSICVASGDNDSGDGESGQHVDYPASDPNAIGCGGLMTPQTGAEQVWNNGGGEGTGGGVSTLFPQQSWQTGAPHSSGRTVPDVAANADPETGFQVYLRGQWGAIGGTSGAAPWIAGCLSVVFGQLKTSPGLITPTFYQTTACFVDVTIGNNGAYRATAGIDCCTGVGRMDVTAFMNRLVGTPPVQPPPVINPPPTPVQHPIQIDIYDAQLLNVVSHRLGLSLHSPARSTDVIGLGK